MSMNRLSVTNAKNSLETMFSILMHVLMYYTFKIPVTITPETMIVVYIYPKVIFLFIRILTFYKFYTVIRFNYSNFLKKIIGKGDSSVRFE